MRGLTGGAAAVLLLTATMFAATRSADEEKVWTLEKAYWQYVQANDLKSYRALWRSDFLGWPLVSSEPLRKDHVTDWITTLTGEGLALKSYDVEEVAIQVSGNLATAAYRVRQTWVDKNGTARTSVIRILHTWVRDGETWQIVSGMSAPTNADGR